MTFKTTGFADDPAALGVSIPALQTAIDALGLPWKLTPTPALMSAIGDTVDQLRAVNEETAGAFVRVRPAD